MTNPPPVQAPAAPAALLLIAPGCTHCAGNLTALTAMVKEGVVGRLEVVNIASDADTARELGVRSVPWTRIGPFVLDGARSDGELRQWAQRVSEPNGMSEYFRELLGDGRLGQVNGLIQSEPGLVTALLPLLEDPETGIHVRVGMGAALEELEGGGEVERLVDGIGRLSSSDDVRTRQDACHYLGLTRSARARPYLEPRLEDPDALVREIAAEALDQLGDVAGD